MPSFHATAPRNDASTQLAWWVSEHAADAGQVVEQGSDGDQPHPERDPDEHEEPNAETHGRR